MSEQWGTLTTEGVSFADFCRALVGVPAARACDSQRELEELLGDVHVAPPGPEPGVIHATTHGWARSSPEHIQHAFKALSGDHPHAHVRAYHCDTRGYDIERTYTHTPEPRPTTSFGDLRGALARGASEETFADLCALLGSTSPDPRILEYVRGHVASWPEGVTREAPLSWIWRRAIWGTCPQLELCDSVRFPSLRGREDAGGEDDRYHLSIRPLGLSSRDVLMRMFGPGSHDVASLEDFTEEYLGTHVHAPRTHEALITYDHANTYSSMWNLERAQRALFDQMLHVYVSNARGDYAYMRLYDGIRLLYHEDLQSPLPLEVILYEPDGQPHASPIDRIQEHPARLLRGARRRVEAAGADPADVFRLSRVAGWFDGAPPDPHEGRPAREEDLMRCLRGGLSRRDAPTSRDDLDDPLDPWIPF